MKRVFWLFGIVFTAGIIACGGGSVGVSGNDAVGPGQDQIQQQDQIPQQDQGQGLSVDTKTDKTKYKAGETVSVSCVVSGGDGTTEITVMPSDGVTKVSEGTYKIIKTGPYQATCGIKGTAVKDSTPATFTVVHGDPANIELSTKPKKKGFKIKDRVKIIAKITDKFDNPCDDAELNPFKTAPQGILTDVPNKPQWLEFQAEGKVTVTVSVKDFDSVKGQLTLWCDQNPPVIDVTSPARGSMLTGDPKVEVQGKITDQVSGVDQVQINGQDVGLETDGTFNFVIDSSHGMNLINIQATDKAGNTAKVIQTYLFSDQYYPDMLKPDPAKALVDEAIDVWASKDTFDDQDHDPTNLNDLSTIVEVIMMNLDWNTLLPNPVTNFNLLGTKYDLYLTNVSIKSAHVSMTPFSGGLRIKADLNKFHADMELKRTSGWGLKDIKGSMDADAVNVTMKVFPQVGPNGEIHSDVQGVNVQLSGLKLKIGLSLPLDMIKGTIEKQLKDQIEKQVGPALDKALNALNMDKDFPLKPFIGDGEPLNLHIKTQVQDLTFTDAGMFAGMKGSLTAPKKIEPHNQPLGSIGRGTCLTGTKHNGTLPQQNKMELGAFDDLLNQAMFALWWGGFLNLDATDKDLGQDLSQYGIKSLHIVTDPYLPPNINGCKDDEKLYLQLGDMGVSVDLDMGGPGHIDMFMSLEAELVLGVKDDNGTKKITFDIKDPKVYTQFVKLTGSMEGKEQMLEGLMGTMIDQLLGQLKKKFAGFEIPAIDLHSFMEGIPEGTVLNITIESLKRILGYTVAIAHLGK